MLVTERIIRCVNPHCPHPENPATNLVCAACQTPLIRRYVIAVNEAAARYPVGELVGQRYEVIAPHIWLDTQPGLTPQIPGEIDAAILPYLRLYPHRLHLPQVYGVVWEQEQEILLLENVPLDGEGRLYPGLAEVWSTASGVRQVYWLWQILQLWQPLLDMGVAASLLNPENLRVQGWCVRLIQLNGEYVPKLKEIGDRWESWVANAHPSVAEGLRHILGMLRSTNPDLSEILIHLNQLLLAAAAELPLRLQVMGATDAGEESLQNEDACFPTNKDVIDDPLLPRVAIVADGIGGHEGGEVASQMAVQSLKLQARAYLYEVENTGEIIPPEILSKQLAASLRVVNNLICTANNTQQRQGKQRMGTTIAIAIQVPQRVTTITGWDGENSHEVYIGTVGDSRAYLITRDGCQLLTIDDDVSTREVCAGRSLYRKALERTDATGLTQALGAKDGEYLHPHTQRIIIDEDAILLLCSDGLSDNLLVERTWEEFALPILNHQSSLEENLYAWLKRAIAVNGHDNISLVLTYYRVSTDEPESIEVEQPPESEPELIKENLTIDATDIDLEPLVSTEQPNYFISDEQEELNSENPSPVNSKTKKSRWNPVVSAIAVLLILVTLSSVGLFAWWKYAPQSFQQACSQLPASWQRRICRK